MAADYPVSPMSIILYDLVTLLINTLHMFLVACKMGYIYILLRLIFKVVFDIYVFMYKNINIKKNPQPTTYICWLLLNYIPTKSENSGFV